MYLALLHTVCAFLCPCSPPALWTQLSLTPPSGHRGPCPHCPDPLARPLELQSLAGPTRSLSLPSRWWPPPGCSPDLRCTDAFSPWQGSLRPQVQMFEALALCAVSGPAPCAPGTSCLRDVCPVAHSACRVSGTSMHSPPCPARTTRACTHTHTRADSLCHSQVSGRALLRHPHGHIPPSLRYHSSLSAAYSTSGLSLPFRLRCTLPPEPSLDYVIPLPKVP